MLAISWYSWLDLSCITSRVLCFCPSCGYALVVPRLPCFVWFCFLCFELYQSTHNSWLKMWNLQTWKNVSFFLAMSPSRPSDPDSSMPSKQNCKCKENRHIKLKILHECMSKQIKVVIEGILWHLENDVLPHQIWPFWFWQ